MNKQTNLSEHFSLRELTKTSVNIENVPNEAQVESRSVALSGFTSRCALGGTGDG